MAKRLNYEKVIRLMQQERPGFNWDQNCARLVFYSVWALSGLPLSKIIAYDPARAGYAASKIAGINPYDCPVGGIHYWQYDKNGSRDPRRGEGHIGVEVTGNGQIFMTGNSSAVSQSLGYGFGLVDFADYQKRKNHPYLGWSLNYGANVSIVEDNDTEKEFLMALTDKQQDTIAKKVDVLYYGFNNILIPLMKRLDTARVTEKSRDDELAKSINALAEMMREISG